MSDQNNVLDAEVSAITDRFEIVRLGKHSFLATTIPLLPEDDLETDLDDLWRLAVKDWKSQRSDAGHDLIVYVRAKPVCTHSPVRECEKMLFVYAKIPPEGIGHIVGAAYALTEHLLDISSG